MGMLFARRRNNNKENLTTTESLTPKKVEEVKVKEVKPQTIVKDIPKQPKQVEVEPKAQGSTEPQLKFKV